MRATLDAIRHLLACPRCGGPLDAEGASLRCATASCGLSFPSVGRWPVLVDFEASVLDRERVLATGARTLAPRVTGVMRKVRNLLYDTESASSPRMLRLRELIARKSDPLVLVVGGGTVGGVFRPLYDDPAVRVIGFDIYASDETQFIADAHQIPLAPGSVDAVIIVAVLEHVVDPWRVVGEIRRVLTDEGAVFAETPFLQHVHEGPYDFTRFTDSGHRYLFRNFERVLSGVAAGLGTQLLWSIESFVRGLTRSFVLGRITRLLFLWLRWFDRAVPESFSVDGASAVWFLGTKSERAMTPREVVEYYRGAQRS